MSSTTFANEHLLADELAADPEYAVVCDAHRDGWLEALEADTADAAWEDLISEDRPLPQRAA